MARQYTLRYRIPASILAAALLLNACTTYVPAPAAPIPMGTRVRVLLNRPTDVPLRDVTANRVVSIDGELVRADADRVVLSAFTVVTAGGLEFLSAGETVSFPRGDVAALQKKKIALLSSALFVGGTVLAVILLDAAARQLTGGGDDAGTGTGQPR